MILLAFLTFGATMYAIGYLIGGHRTMNRQ